MANSILQGMNHSDLQPAAQQIGNVSGYASKADVAENPDQTRLSQLASALGHLQPSLTDAIIRHDQVVQQEDMSAGAIAAAQLQHDKTVGDINEAVKQGKIPLGASPTFIRAGNVKLLELRGIQTGQNMHEAWLSPENDAARNSGDPNAFHTFADKFKREADKSTLFSPDGQPRFTDLEQDKSNYHEIVNSAWRQGSASYLQYQSSEREKANLNTAGNLLSTIMKNGTEGKLPGERDAVGTIEKMKDVFRGPMGLSTYGGLSGAVASKLTADAIIGHAVATGDASVLDLAHQFETSPNNTLGATKYFSEKEILARNAIAEKNWTAGEHERTLATREAKGEGSIADLKAKESRDAERIEKDYQQRQSALADKQTKEASVYEESRTLQQMAADGISINSPYMKQHLDQLRRADPQEARTVQSWLHAQESGLKKEREDAAGEKAFARMRSDISNDPAKFDSARILQSANRGEITSGQVDSLFNHVDTARKATKEFPMLESQPMQSLRSDLKAAVGGNPMNFGGQGAIDSNNAMAEFNELARSYARSNPKATEWDITEAMQKKVKEIAAKYNPELASVNDQPAKPTTDQLSEVEVDYLKSKAPKSRAEAEQMLKQFRSSH